MNHLSKSQALTAAILICVVVFVSLVLLALIDFSLFFVALIVLIVAICLLRIKKPEIFSIFGRDSGGKADEDIGGPGGEAFNAHIVLLYHNGTSMQQVEVNKPEFSIGRDPKCSFVLTGNTNISRSHVIIRYDAEKKASSIIDNNSTHGTKLNGSAMVPNVPQVLRNGDIIQIEDRILTVQSKNY